MQTFARIATGLVLLIAATASAQSPINFTGHWRQKTSAKAQRQLDIEQKDKILLVKTTITNSEGARSMEVKYQIAGPPATYTGLDGDEFHSSVHWDGSALVFDITEHEDGKDIPQKIVWTLSADGHTLQVDRLSEKSGRQTHSVATYIQSSK